MGRREAIVLGGLLALIGAAPAAADDLADLRPELAYDSDEDHFAQPASRSGETIARHVVHGRETTDEGARFLQYWLFYAQNTQDRGVLGTGRHEGDWEFLQLRLGGDGEPVTATFAQHSVAERCPYGDLEVDGGAPVVYVANGSHASYPRSGTVDRQWPDPNDEADGAGRRARPALVRIGDSDPAWVADERPWGSTEAGWFPGEQSSPPGPRFQADGRWDDPAGFERSARACGSDPPSRSWQTPALAGTGAVLLLAGLLIARRRRVDRRG